LLVIKWWIMIVDKTAKVSRQIAIWEKLGKKTPSLVPWNAERTKKLAWLVEKAKRWKIALTIANTFLNWFAETLIWATLAKSLAVTLWYIKTVWISSWKKIVQINKTIKEMEEVLKVESNKVFPDEARKENIKEAIRKLREEKVKLERPKDSVDEIKRIAWLSDEQRIEEIKKIFPKITLKQKARILHIHHWVSEWVFWNSYSEIRKMRKELKSVWFDKKQIGF